MTNSLHFSTTLNLNYRFKKFKTQKLCVEMAEILYEIKMFLRSNLICWVWG